MDRLSKLEDDVIEVKEAMHGLKETTDSLIKRADNLEETTNDHSEQLSKITATLHEQVQSNQHKVHIICVIFLFLSNELFN